MSYYGTIATSEGVGAFLAAIADSVDSAVAGMGSAPTAVPPRVQRVRWHALPCATDIDVCATSFAVFMSGVTSVRMHVAMVRTVTAAAIGAIRQHSSAPLAKCVWYSMNVAGPEQLAVSRAEAWRYQMPVGKQPLGPWQPGCCKLYELTRETGGCSGRGEVKVYAGNKTDDKAGEHAGMSVTFDPVRRRWRSEKQSAFLRWDGVVDLRPPVAPPREADV